MSEKENTCPEYDYKLNDQATNQNNYANNHTPAYTVNLTDARQTTRSYGSSARIIVRLLRVLIFLFMALFVTLGKNADGSDSILFSIIKFVRNFF